MKIVNLASKPISLYKVMSEEKKSVIWYTFCNIMQKGIGFLTIPIITRLLSTSEYGEYSVFISWRDIFIIFATLELYCGVYTKLLVDNQEEQDICTSSLQGLGFFTTTLFALIYFVFKDFINELLGFSTLVMVMMILYFYFFPAFTLWCTKQRVNNKYISMVVVTLISSLLTPIVSIILLLVTDMRAEAVIIGNSVIYILFGLFFFILNIYKGKKLFDKNYWTFSLKYNLPLIPHYLSMFVLNQSDRLMIKYFCNESKAGIYSLAYQISNIMNIVYNAVNNAFVPKAYKHLKNGEISELKTSSMNVIKFTAILTLIPILIAPECVLIMGGQEYMEAIYILPAVCMAVFARFCYSFPCNIEFYFSKTNSVMITSLIGAVVNIVLNWIFIPKLGYLAAGYTTLVSYILIMIFHYFFGKKISISNFGKSVFNDKEYFGIIIGCVLISIALLITYKYNILRYVIIAVISAVSIINYKKIIKIFKKMLSK